MQIFIHCDNNGIPINQFIERKDRSATYIDMHTIGL